MAFLKSLTVEKFRGILDSTLVLESKSLILHGENGCGKSSFVDAIEFFYKGEVSHLQGAEGISLIRHGPHALHSKDNSRITIEFTSPSDNLSRSFEGLNKASTVLSDHLSLGATASFILRRRNLLGFIASQAATRYEQLAELIGIKDLDAVELNLKRQTDDALIAVREAKQKIYTASTNLTNALGHAPDSDEVIVSALNAKLTDLGQRTLQSVAEITPLKATIVAEAKSPDEFARVVALQAAMTKFENTKSALNFLKKHTAFWAGLRSFQKDTSAMREQAYQLILSQASDLLKTQRPTNCPICERPFDDKLSLDIVVSRVEGRLSQLQLTSGKATELQSAQAALRADVESTLNFLKESSSQIRTYLSTTNLDNLNAVAQGLTTLLKDLDKELLQLDLKSPSEYFAVDLQNACDKLLTDTIGQLQTLSQQTAPTDNDRAAAKAVELLALVDQERSTLITARTDLGAKQAVHTVISTMYEHFLETKKTEVQKIFDDLQNDIRRYYDIIHPGEGHRTVSLILPQGRRASAHIKMGFYHCSDEDPRGYNSEAHLDSLGLCIFLAFTKRFNGGFPLIVLGACRRELFDRRLRCIVHLAHEQKIQNR